LIALQVKEIPKGVENGVLTAAEISRLNLWVFLIPLINLYF